MFYNINLQFYNLFNKSKLKFNYFIQKSITFNFVEIQEKNIYKLSFLKNNNEDLNDTKLSLILKKEI